jgi:hypothetical protein
LKEKQYFIRIRLVPMTHLHKKQANVALPATIMKG